MSTPFKTPSQLPIEVWEQVIDCLGDDNGRDSLLACCLTCRTWLPRSRFHLYSSVTLRSRQDLAHVINTICNSTTLCDRVNTLTIVGDADDDVSWISVVPLHLAPKLKYLDEICFHGVDFRRMNPRIQAFYALFRPVRFLTFKDIQWSQLNQMTRLASAVRAEIFSVDPRRYEDQNSSAEAPHNVTPNPVTLPSLQRLVLRYPDLRYIQISLPPDILDSISQSWSFPVASLGTIFIVTDWPGRSDSGWRMHLGTLRRIINLVQQLFASVSSFGSCTIEYWLPSGSVDAFSKKCYLIFMHKQRNSRDPPRRNRFHLRLNYNLDTTNHDDFTSAARFLSVVARMRPDVVELRFTDRETGTTHPDQITWTPANDVGPMANLLARWKYIDDVLSDAFAEVARIKVAEIPQYHLGDFDCVNPLVTQLLPRLNARNVFLPCNGKNCYNHELYKSDGIGSLRRVAVTSSFDIENPGPGWPADDGNIVEVGEGGIEDGDHADDDTL